MTGESYIGKSTNIENRIMYHFQDLEKNMHSNKGLQQDYNEGHKFTWEVLKEIDYGDKLDDDERAEIARYNTFYEGYNNTPGGGYDDYKGGWDIYDRLPVSKYKENLWIECPKCGKALIKGFRNCQYCGEKLENESMTISEPEDKGEWHECPSCGRINFSNDKCYFCKGYIIYSIENPNSQQLAVSKKPWIEHKPTSQKEKEQTDSDKLGLDIKKYKDMKRKYEGSKEWFKFSRRIRYNKYVKQVLLERQDYKCVFSGQQLDTINSFIFHIDYDCICTNSREIKVSAPTSKRPNRKRVLADCEHCSSPEKCFSKLLVVHKDYKNHQNSLRSNIAKSMPPHDIRITEDSKGKRASATGTRDTLDITNFNDMMKKYRYSTNWFRFSSALKRSEFMKQTLLERQNHKCALSGRELDSSNSFIFHTDFDNICTNKLDCRNCKYQEKCLSKLLLLHKEYKKHHKRLRSDRAKGIW